MNDTATKTRIPLAEAERLAVEVVEMLRPCCERIEIAGSIRRRRADCGDIEIVCIPKPGETVLPVRHLFDWDRPPGEYAVQEFEDVLDHVTVRCDELVKAGVIAYRLDKNGRAAFGTKYKRLMYRDFALDLFSVLPPAQWGVLFMIRTGPAEFSHRLVTKRTQGGLLPDWYRVHDGALIWAETGESIDTPTEESFFEAVGLKWLPPEQRR